MTIKTTLGLAGGLALALSGPALADENRDPNMPKLGAPYGMSVAAGGGIAQFADSAMRDFANPAGTWDLRLAIGTRSLIAVEAVYSGGLQSIEALGLDDSALLLSTGLGANLRVNLLEGEWQPYVLAGGGWNRYSVTNADFNTSSVRSSDDVLEIPVGAGLSYRYRRLIADARILYRTAIGADLVQVEDGGEAPRLDAFGANLTLGIEF